MWNFTCANRQKVCAIFCCRISQWTKVFYILKTAEIVSHSSLANSTSNPERVGTDWGFETHKVCHSNKQNTSLPSHPTDFFNTQTLGGHVTSRNQCLSSNDLGKQRGETLVTRLHSSMSVTRSYHHQNAKCMWQFWQTSYGGLFNTYPTRVDSSLVFAIRLTGNPFVNPIPSNWQESFPLLLIRHAGSRFLRTM